MPWDRLFERDPDDAGPHHAERARCADRYVDDPASNERAAIVDAATDRVTCIDDGHHASESAGAMRAGHLASVSVTAIVRSEPALGPGLGSDRGERKHSQKGAVHGCLHCDLRPSFTGIGEAWVNRLVPRPWNDRGGIR